MTRERRIPESRIALNPVVVDDSKRGEPTRCPLDKHALMEWLNEQALEAHNAETFSCNGESTDFDSGVFAGREKMANDTIKKIQNGRVRQQHRQLVPRGWSEVD